MNKCKLNLNKRNKICVVATVPFALHAFMKPHIEMLAEQYDVTLIANGLESDMSSLLNENVHFIPMRITRKVSIVSDIAALINLYQVFRRERFSVVHSIMPKSGLLAMIAAFLTKVPYRIHIFTGQVWANKVGFVRGSLKFLDRVTAKCSTHILADSFSQRRFLIEQNIVVDSKISVLGNGSICGVDIKRFGPDLIKRCQIRSTLNIPDSAVVYLFLGRLNKDKGIQDLAKAFAEIADSTPSAHLLVVGPDEGGMDEILNSLLKSCSHQFHRVGFTNKPEDYMAMADIFCLPSYREGFGSVVIEAASVGLPTVASNIYGLIDAVKDGETGILHPPSDIEEIKRALLVLTNNAEMREELSKKAMARAHDMFSMNSVVDAMRQYYVNLSLR